MNAIPTWQPNPASEEGYQVDDLVTADGTVIARIEDFDHACYPCAINATTGNLERHGPTQDRVAGMLWAERVAGVHPTKSGDERAPFYYRAAAS